MLTDSSIKGEIKKATTEVTLRDISGGKGGGSLLLKIRPGRATIWLARWQKSGRQTSKSLGRYPALGLREAREKFREQISDPLQLGRNPKALVVVEGKPTLGRMCDGYILTLTAREASGAVGAKWHLDRARKHIGDERISAELEPADIAAYLEHEFRTGSRAIADKSRAWLHAAFNWAIMSTHDYTVAQRRDWGMKSNPVSMVPSDSQASEPREFSLTPAELKAVWYGTRGDGFSLEVGCLLRLIVCCGQRVQETLRTEGREIDLERGLWTMPLKKRKGGRKPGAKAKALKPHVIPLPAHAVEIFKTLIAVHGDGPLFPARHGAGVLIEYHSVSRALARWLDHPKRGKNKVRNDCQARDIRRTWKTLTEEAGLDPFTRDYIQQHAQGGTARQVYDQSTYLGRMRDGMAKWERWLIANDITVASASGIDEEDFE